MERLEELFIDGELPLFEPETKDSTCDSGPEDHNTSKPASKPVAAKKSSKTLKKRGGKGDEEAKLVIN